MPVEITITLKDEEKRMTHKFLIYEPFQMISTDPVISQCLKEAVSAFGSEPETYKIKATLL